MRGLNKVTLIGNLGNAPTQHTLENGISVTKLMLATTEIYKDKNGAPHTETEWHTILLWRSLSDLAEKYLKKGSLIYVEGKLKSRSYLNKEGIKCNVTEIIADEFIMLDKRNETAP